MFSRIAFAVNLAVFSILLIALAVTFPSGTQRSETIAVPARYEISHTSSADEKDGLKNKQDHALDVRADEGTEGALAPLHLEARAAFRGGDVDGAIKLLLEHLASAPADATARNDLGVYYLKKGDDAHAEEAFRAAAESDPRLTRASFNLGTLYLKTDRPDLAIKAFSRALERNPYDGDALYNRALASAQLDDWDGAERDYRAVANNDRSLTGAKALYNLSLILGRQKRFKEAVDALRAELRIRPDDVAGRFNLAVLLTRMGDQEQAKQEYRKLLAIDSSYAQAHCNLGLALRRSGDHEAALAEFRLARDLRPNEPRYHYNIALAESVAGRLDAAAQAYERAIELSPGYFRALYNLGLLEYRRERYREAAAWLERAVAVRGDHYAALYNHGLALLKLDRPADAEAAFRKALAIDNTVDAEYSLGLALSRQGRTVQALDAYRTALTLDPKHAHSIAQTGEALAKLGRHDEAIARFVLLRKLDPADPSAYNTGLSLFRSGAFEACLPYFDVGAAGDGSVRRKSLNMKGAALAKLGRPQDAITVYRQALVEFPGEPMVVRNLARAYAARGDHAAALDELQTLRAAKGDEAETLVLIGEEQNALGRKEAAREAFKKALELKPNDAEAKRGLAVVSGAVP